MTVEISEEAWLNFDRFLRETPNLVDKLPAFRDALDESQRVGWQEGEKIGARQTQQRILVRQLRRRFPQAPETVVQRIEATESMDVLDRWLDEIVIADDLADTELGRLSLESQVN